MSLKYWSLRNMRAKYDGADKSKTVQYLHTSVIRFRPLDFV